MEFLAHRLKSGRIEHTTIIVRVLPNESKRSKNIEVCFVKIRQQHPLLTYSKFDYCHWNAGFILRTPLGAAHITKCQTAA